jgi:hypothetical protein
MLQKSPPRGAGGDVEPGRLTLTSDIDGAVLVMAVSGPWARPLPEHARAQLRTCLTDHPPALIIDLHGLDDPTAASAPVWLIANRTGTTMRPSVRVALCTAPDTPIAGRLRLHGRQRRLPVFDTLADARAALAGDLPLTDLIQQRLAAVPRSARDARRLVSDACHTWQLPDLLTPARLVMSELVANAIQHAGTNMLITVTRRGAGIYLAVRDGNPALPEINPPEAIGPLHERGRGLHLVQANATAWGALPSHDGYGKVVWATVQ